MLAVLGALVSLPAAGPPAAAGGDGSTDAYLESAASTRLPSIAGLLEVGQTLTVVFDGVVADGSTMPNDKAAPYVWYRCDRDGLACVVAHASGAPTYLVQTSDSGHTLRASVSALEAGGVKPAISAQTPTVKDAGAPAAGAAQTPPAAGDAGAGTGARLSVVAFSTSPQARAGRRFAARLRVSAPDGAVIVRCTARVAARTLPVKVTFESGVATCNWRMPAGAAGEQVRGTVRVAVGDAAAQRSFARRVLPG